MDLAPSSHRRKSNTPKRFVPITEPCSGTRMCTNSACRAVYPVSDPFCTRCSCCICRKYDDNKDPSLWLECTPGSPVRPCGKSCHIKCALEHGKIGVGNVCQMLRLDGGYWCSFCGNITGILGCLKKQLTIAKDSRRVDILCHRINLTAKLLNGTLQFQDILEIVTQAKSVLEEELGSLDGLSSTMARSLVSRLPVAAQVHQLCIAAIRMADERFAALSIANVENEGQDLWMPDQMVFPGTSEAMSPRLDLNMAAEPELDAGVAPINDSIMDDADLAGGGSENWALVVVPNEELPAVNFQAEVASEGPASTEAHGDLNEEVEVVPVNDSSMENADPGCGGSENWALVVVPNEELPAVNFQADVASEGPASTEAHGDLNEVPVSDSLMESVDPGCGGSENWARVPCDELHDVNVEAEVAIERPAGVEAHGNLSVDAAPVSDSSMENEDHGCGGTMSWAQQGPNEGLPDVNVEAEVARVRLASPEVRGKLDENYEYCINVIRGLEVDNHITSEERQKLFTWYSLKSNEHQRDVVHTYIKVFGSDLSSLTEQLLDSFGDAIEDS